MNEIDINPQYPDALTTLGIDFDGVVHDESLGFDGGYIRGTPIKGTKWGLMQLRKMGYKLIAYSCKARSDRNKVNEKTGKELIVDWLKDWDLLQYFIGVTAEKPSCCLIIDNNAYRFINWKDCIKFVKGMK